MTDPLSFSPAFFVSRAVRAARCLDDALFSAPDGRLSVPDFATARKVAALLTAPTGAAVPASEVQALALLDAAGRAIIHRYECLSPGTLARAYARSRVALGEARLEAALLAFVRAFPPSVVAAGNTTAEAWLDASEGEIPRRLRCFADAMLLHVARLNPAAAAYQAWFEVNEFAEEIREWSDALPACFEPLVPVGGLPPAESLFETLRAPALAVPDSLVGQLRFVLERHADMFDGCLAEGLLRGIDFLREEEIRCTGPGDSGGHAPVLEFGGSEGGGNAEDGEPDRFSEDRDWMPQLVLLAKNTYVWLDQLSKRHGRGIHRLDQIPEEDLADLARRGFTGLWLIGVWERSRASAAIKRRMGDADAVASAYSLSSYDVAEDLGGWQALECLRERAAKHGLRLAADMVPNHMGIDSRWVNEHPQWFLSLPDPPYPGYAFDGPDLGSDASVGIFLEDHYYTRTDAAVVFQRLDRRSGEIRYIYHGNDGTSMPWNDTAQLNYLLPEVREAVIQTILHVARNFPVIRFDAAMTLARKHIQRLWFPEPGGGGAIPSRTEHGMSKAEFDRRLPVEFWREVVDRVAAEAPDTLLLAEAFWLMEGYFVRTLGMHRVYNSAFMHMLRDEDNAGYRSVMRNVLEFDPRILQRFVNFMNNPDERTAVDQFGKGDKYFGICVLMCTLPGLPMFGHGQIEGFAEKYGMEFRRARWEETPDEGFIRHHEEIIFPLLHHRALFAGVEHFFLYDAVDPAGHVNEDVFAFSNRRGDERALVVYQNRHADCRVTLRLSTGFATGLGIERSSLADGLNLPDGELDFVLFREAIGGGEFIRSCRDLVRDGWAIDLAPYQCRVFLDWRLVQGEEWKECRQKYGNGPLPPAVRSSVADSRPGATFDSSGEAPDGFTGRGP